MIQVRKAEQADKPFVSHLEQAYWNKHAFTAWGEWRDERFEEVWTDNGYEIVLLNDVRVGLFRVSRQGVSLYNKCNPCHVSISQFWDWEVDS
ncbi:MAG: hypothetical protein JOZ78_17795 [Chroococcidiopsidaceae cyanobacterium CP_BM_ER_R8_30]|nr:hypothetical protein [Chroococcidiopsidaceae cyanobacterium CP_BM_ER_R8_30]